MEAQNGYEDPYTNSSALRSSAALSPWLQQQGGKSREVCNAGGPAYRKRRFGPGHPSVQERSAARSKKRSRSPCAGEGSPCPEGISTSLSHPECSLGIGPQP